MLDNDRYWLTRSYIPAEIKKQVNPVLLPYDHPARELLDRAYQNKDKFTAIGHGRYITLKKVPGLLEKHGLVIKEPNLDVDAKPTQQLRRVQGHLAGRQFIEKNKIDHVKIPQNWLYPLPGVSSKTKFIAYNLAILLRVILKILHISAPRWLKNVDLILRDRFVIVEKFVKIQPFEPKILHSLPKKIVEQYENVFEVVGFDDAHERNFSLAEDGTITLLDLDKYSKTQAKNKFSGKIGINYLFFRDKNPDPGKK